MHWHMQWHTAHCTDFAELRLRNCDNTVIYFSGWIRW